MTGATEEQLRTPPPPPVRKIYRDLAWVAVPLVLIDQMAKLVVDVRLPYGTFRPLVPDFFALVHWRNTGAAWGMFQHRTDLLSLVSAAVLILLLVFVRHLDCRSRRQAGALGLIVGGIVGNLIDRVCRGSVVDFLFFYHGQFQWPAFNVADCGITVGVILYCFWIYFTPKADAAVPPAET